MLDAEQINKVLNELINMGDYEGIKQVQGQLEYQQSQIHCILYELDMKLDALTEREAFFEEGEPYDS